MLFNSLTISARVAWRADHPWILMPLRVLAELFIYSLPLVFLVTTYAVLSIALRPRSPAPLSGFLGRLAGLPALARLPLPATQRESHLPGDPSIVCWDQDYWGKSWLEENYFRNYSRRVESGSLRPWDCYRL